MIKITGFPVRISDDVVLAYVGSRWVVPCGGVAYGPFDQEHSEAVMWLYRHCLSSPDDDPTCKDGRKLSEHQILALEGVGDTDPYRRSNADGMPGTGGTPPNLEGC